MNGFLGNENAPGMNTEMARKALDVLSIAKYQLLGFVKLIVAGGLNMFNFMCG